MSKNKKKELLFKANVLVNVFEPKEHSTWNSGIADTIVRDDDPLKNWKGVFSIYNYYFSIKSRNKTYMKKYLLDKICGLLTPGYSNKVLILGLCDEKMLYYVIRFERENEKESALEMINKLKGPDKTEISASLHTMDESYSTDNTNGTTFVLADPTPHNDNFRRGQIPKIPEDVVDSGEGQNIVRKEIKVTSQVPSAPRRRAPQIPTEEHSSLFKNDRKENHQPSGDISDDSDVNPGTWMEDVKYIAYEPSRGGNVECDEGSIYMYTAHQIVPSESYADSYGSDSDSN